MKPKRKPLSDCELQQRLGQERLNALSLGRFGAVMISNDVVCGRREVDWMFRGEPEPGVPFSGWTFFSSDDTAGATCGLALHDCLAILRVAPEVAQYLDMPPGSALKRTGKITFEEYG